MVSENDDVEQPGTFVLENWKAACNGVPAREALEYPLFSDSRIIGEITEGLGPYQLLNCIADPGSDPLQPVLALRSEYHVQWNYADMNSTDDLRYHGGADSDEFAALLSLTLGIRLKSGDPTRWFQTDADPRGRPWSFRQSGRPNPVVVRSGHGRVIPRTAKDHQLVAPPRLARFPELRPPDAIALTRAARLYQDAMWIAESEPALAWLLMVSAIETAAVCWRRGQETPRERLRASQPDLNTRLEQVGGADFADEVATMLADYLGATKKFIDFCLAHFAPPPDERPSEHLRIDWNRRVIKKALSLIYKYRSRALHAGTPFPAPMCWAPSLYGEPLAERLVGGAAGSLGGIWIARDIPMFFHTFEHIARHTLLAWWDSLYPAHMPAYSADG